MKILTWNVNSIRIRLNHLLCLLQRYDIDIALLQEIKCAPEAFPSQQVEDYGYNSVCYSQKTYNGVAILSKYIIEETQDGSSIFGDPTQTRYIEALTNGYTVASVYVPNGQDKAKSAPGEPYLYKLGFMQKLSNHINNCGYDKCNYIIGGDFNITRDDLDTYDPKIWNEQRISCTPLERRSIADFIVNTNMRDLMREYNCTDFTWFDYRSKSFENNRGLRIDYIFASQAVNTCNCYTLMEYRAMQQPSDHVPVIAEIG